MEFNASMALIVTTLAWSIPIGYLHLRNRRLADRITRLEQTLKTVDVRLTRLEQVVRPDVILDVCQFTGTSTGTSTDTSTGTSTGTDSVDKYGPN